MSMLRVYDLAKLLFMTTNIKVLRRYTTPDSREHTKTLFEGDLMNIPTNIQYKCIESIEAQDEDLIALYVYE